MRIRARQACHDACSAQSARYRITEFLKLTRDGVSGPVFFKAQLGMRVKVAPQLCPMRMMSG
jgi:hypothetical protein